MKDITQLKQQLKESTDPHQRSKLLLELAAEAWKTGEYNSGKTFAEAALELGMNLGEESVQAEALHLIGTFYAYLDDYDAALEYYLRAQRLNQQLGNKNWEAEAYNSMGDIFIQLSNIPKATECFEKSHALHSGYERSVNNLGYLRMLKGELDAAIGYYRQALAIAQENRNIRSMIISHINISDILCKQQEPEAALAELDEASALMHSSTVETPKEISCALSLNQAMANKALGNQELALQLLLEARDQAEQNLLQNYQLKSQALLADYYAEQQQWEAAFKAQFAYSQLYGQIISSDTIKKANSIQSYYARENRNLISMNLTERSARLATLGILSSGITHELNQPLSAIRISTESILYWLKREEITLPMNFNQELAHIMEGVKRIEAFLQQIRQFWNSGKTAEIKLCSLDETIEQSLCLLSRRIFAGGIVLISLGCGSFPPIKAAPTHLQQIIINLLAHCVSILERCPRKQKVLKIEACCADGKLCLDIMQNGVEVTREMMNQLYNPLSPDTQNAASEMGMAIVKYLCDHYGYRLNIHKKDDAWGFRLHFGDMQ
jgi:C4-dicarboxylate-specific signal transduction histidine kinase